MEAINRVTIMKSRFLSAFLFFFLISFSLQAGEFLAEQTVSIAEKKNTDIYAASSMISVTAPIKGDLWSVSGTALINAPISGDFNGLGGTVVIGSEIQDDLRIAGGTLQIQKGSRGDMILAGGSIQLSESAFAGEDLIAAGGQIQIDGDGKQDAYVAGGHVTINGAITRNAHIMAETLILNGDIHGDAVIRVQNSPVIGPNARFHGKVRYWTANGPVDFGSSVPAENLEFDPSLRIQEFQSSPSPDLSGLGFLMIGSSITLMGLLIYLFPGFVRASSNWLNKNPVQALGFGLLYFLILPLVAIVLGVLVVTLPLSFFLLSIFGFSISFALALSSPLLTEAILQRMGKQVSLWSLFGLSIVFHLIVLLVGLIPILGWILSALICLAGMGALLSSTIQTYKAMHAQEG